jgi:hypothetical protein
MDFCYGHQEKEGKSSWRYRAKDYRWEENRGAGLEDAWVPTELKALYDNDDRLARSFMLKSMKAGQETGEEFRSDPELEWYLETFLKVMPHFKVNVVNCSPAGMLKNHFETLPLGEAVQKYCKARIQGGRTILPHLGSILLDPRRQAGN